jgi:short-subunit dehydrogenase
MDGMRAWLTDRLRERPWWMNALLLFCAFMTFIYMPWDFFVKPVAADREAWFGILLHGAGAKLTEPIHWVIYAAGMYGLWRMRPWVWPWAPVYSATVTLGMFIWPLVYIGGVKGFVLAFVSVVPFALLTRALWRSSELFEPKPLALRDRYGEWSLVTGASAGLGAEFARALAREGMSVVLVARRTERLNALADELRSTCGVEVRVIAADLSRTEEVARVARETTDLELAVLVNNAGAGYVGLFENQDPSRLAEMVALNCIAPVVLTRLALPRMLARRRGAIVMVASVAGRQPIPLHAVYAATKSFDLLLGEALWVELRQRGIDVVALQPGFVATEFEQVAGERRTDPMADETPQHSVRIALEALGRTPSVISGTRMTWLRANLNRIAPRAVVAFLAGDFMAQQTPEESHAPQP